MAAAAWSASPSPTRLVRRVETRLHGTTGRPIGYAAIPPAFREAIVSTEDERFYRHHGIDVVGVVRALPYDVTHFSFAQGASTITEQVAKMLYLGGNDHNPWRKLEDAAVALELERRYTKAQILAAYVNSAYFGHGAYGLRAASERYFGVAPRRLDTAQASLLAGLVQAPSLYDPFRRPGAARTRQAEVLRSLVRNRFLTTRRAQAVLARPLPLAGGTILPPVTGLDLSTGPAFLWWELALGTAGTLIGAAALIAARLDRLHVPRVGLGLRILLLGMVLLGAAAIVRSFRTA